MLSTFDTSNVLKEVEELIDTLPAKSITELFEGTHYDIDSIFAIIFEETEKVIHLNSPTVNTSELNYLPNLKLGYEHFLRCKNLNYFISSVLPEFDIAWYHLEWGSMIQLYKYLCIIASRDHSKSFLVSFAHILWKLYRYEKPTQFYIPSREIQLCKEGMLITNEFKLAKRLLKKVRQEIENNQILRDRLYPDRASSEGWAAESLTCKNGAEVTLSSFHTSNRGPHPGWIVVDDFLDKSALYSKTARDKFYEVFTAEVMNMVLPQGTVDTIGCVGLETLILSSAGFYKMKSLNHHSNFKTKELQDLKIDVLSNNVFDQTSKYFINGKCVTNKIHTTSSYELVCSEIHPLWKMSESGIPDWCKSSDLKVGDWICLKGNDSDFGKEFSLSGFDKVKWEGLNNPESYQTVKLNLPENLDKDLAYLFGLFIAEGSLYKNKKGLEISTGDKEIEDFLLSLNKYGIKFRLDHNRMVVCTSRVVWNFFCFCGFEPTHCELKKIPEYLLSCKKEILKEILRGVFDGDGSCSVDDKGNIYVQLSSTSKELIQTVQTILLMGWNIQSSWTETSIEKLLKQNERRIAKLKAQNKSVDGVFNCNYSQLNLSITGHNAEKFMSKIGFRLSRKVKPFNQVCKDCSTIPFQKSLYQSMNQKRIQEQRFFDDNTRVKGVNGYFSRTKNITRHSIKRILDAFSILCPEYEEYKMLKENSDFTNHWVQIKSITKGEDFTVDFVIPKSHAFVSNGFLSHNTPFHSDDLYAQLKKNPLWKVFEYPAIFPDGRILYKSRYDFQALLEKRRSLGNLIFSREFLVKPITDNVSIFPWSVLSNSFIGMDSLKLVQNRSSYPVKFKKVSLGCDFALSSSVGADYTVYTVVGIDSLNQIHLIHCTSLHGEHYTGQLGHLQRIVQNFNPDTIVMETNGFQKIMAEMARNAGIRNIIDFNTNGFDKKDFYEGVPSLAVTFETGTMKFPRGDEESIQITNAYCSELNSIAFDDTKGTLESVSEHDDKVMSLFFAVKGLKTVNSSFRVSMLDDEDD